MNVYISFGCDLLLMMMIFYAYNMIYAHAHAHTLTPYHVLISYPPLMHKLQSIRVGCGRILSPVCGKDGQTYGNKCLARRAKAGVAYRGECKHKNCSRERRPVCGRDGETYDNKCLAENAHVAVVYDGRCHGTNSNSEYYPEVEDFDNDFDSADYYPESEDYNFDYEDDKEEEPVSVTVSLSSLCISRVICTLLIT